MKTAEEVLVESGLSYSHWGSILIDAEAIGFFTSESKEASSTWMSCACGKLDDHIEREGPYGSPVDYELRRLGNSFYQLVDCDDFLEAALTLVKIEKRSIELLRGDI
tara:strand:- start:497 stop:817 length:321 start_codon:yes stop_codon:yes gene_type:complete